MKNRTMNKTRMIPLLIVLMASITFASNGKPKNPKGLYPNKKPLIHKTTTAISVMSDDVKHLKVRNRNLNAWPASHIHTGCHTKKVKDASSIDRLKRLRKRSRQTTRR